jgi:hypothetical protein
MLKPQRRLEHAQLSPAIGEGKTIAIRLARNLSLLAGQILSEYSAAATNEVQTLTPSGTISGGTYRLTFESQQCAALAFNANAPAIQAALEALSTVGEGNVRVTGGPISSGVVTIEFIGDLANMDVGAITVQSSLTGSTPAVAVAEATKGSGGPGTFGPYTNGASNGLETAKLILARDVVTDNYGRHYLGRSGASEHGTDLGGVNAYYCGVFACEELTGLTSTSAGQLGRLIQGDITNGLLKLA